jgi:hypothetical protein
MTQPTCWNCSHCKGWSHSATLEDPGNSGWECTHADQQDRWEKFENLPELESIVLMAAKCPAYQYQPPEQEYEIETNTDFPDVSYFFYYH